MKSVEKEKAIALRKDGFSYSEIRSTVSVSKSTLSLWLRSVGLAKRHKQRLTEKKLASARRGWAKRHQQRVDLTNEIKKVAKAEIGVLSKRELWLIGVALYWAEGSKERQASIGHQAIFSNSDPLMVGVFLKWLRGVVMVSNQDIIYEIYIHENSKNSVDSARNYWAGVASVEIKEMNRVYFKKNKLSNRKKVYNSYFGQLRIRVRRSSTLNRKIAGWVEGIVQNCGVV